MICNGLRRSEIVCVGLIADDRKHRRKMFPHKTEAIADKRTTNPLQSEEKKARTYFKSDWTCFKENNSVSPIGHRSYQTRVSIKNCRSQKRRSRNGQESRTRFNFPDHPDRCAADRLRRRGQMFPYVCDVAQTYRRLCPRPIADRCRSYGNQALLRPYNGNSF